MRAEKPEAAVGLALQRREVVEQRGALCRRLRLLGHRAGLAGALRGDRVRLRLVPQALGAGVGVVLGLRPLLVEPASGVLAGAGAERAEDFPIAARAEGADLLFPLDHDGERRRLHAADRRQLKPAGLRVERRHRARAVDPDEPIGLGAADGGVGERAHLRVGAQLVEPLANRGGRHGLQPEAPDRLRRFRELHDVAEDELAFAAGVAGVDQIADVLALDEAQQRFQPVFVLLDRLQREFRRDRRQVPEGPFAALDLLFLGHADLEQMPDRRRQHVVGAFEVVVVAREAAQRARDVGGDGGLLGDDQCFRHGRAVRRAADSTEGEAGGARTALPRAAQRASARPRAHVPACKGAGGHRKRPKGPARSALAWAAKALVQPRRCQSPPGSGATFCSSSSAVRCPDRGGDRKRGARRERVDIRGIVSERAQHRAHGGVGFGACVRGRHARCAADDTEFVEDVLRRLDELRAFANQLVPALRERGMDRTRQGEHFAALFAGESRGDERAGRERCLHHEHATGQAAHESVAPREILLLRRRADREFGDHEAARREIVREVAIARRVNAVGPGADDGDAAAGAGETAAMRRGIDAGRKPADDR